MSEKKTARQDLSAADIQRAEERTAISAAIIHEAIREEGAEELKRSTTALWWSGLAAGLSMGFSLAAQGLLRAYLPDEPWTALIYRLGYTVGFIIVVIGRQQLFTENTVTAVIPVLNHRSLANLLKMLKLWIVVLVANLLGAFLFAWVASHSDIFNPQSKQAFLAIGQESARTSFVAAFLKGIFAGWLIALMVWLLPGSEGSRIWVIIITTYILALGELTHIIAGSVEVFYLVALGEISPGGYLLDYMLPTLFGNMVGGVFLVSALNSAQVKAGPRSRN